MTDRLHIEAHRPLPRRWELLWLAAYPLAWVALSSVSNLHWFLPAGLRLGALWLLPRTSWWKMALVEWLAIGLLSLARGAYPTLSALVVSTVLPWCLYALMVWGIGPQATQHPSRMALPRLLGTGAAAAMFTSVAHTATYFVGEGSLPAMLVSYALGDFAGIVLVVPLMLALRDQSGPDRRAWRDLTANGLVLVPLLIAFGLSRLPVIEAPVYPLLLSLVPLFGLTYRHGWRTGAIAMGLLGAGLFVLGPLPQVWGAGQLQLLIAASGCAALLLGVASETERAQRSALAQTVEALSVRRTLLTDAANRLSSLQEEERRRIGVELHDVIGQDMTAIATRLRVVERTATEDGVKSGLASIGRLVADAHVHLREVIHQLHPAALDRFGLARALSEGPMAQMLRDLGIDYVAEINGDLDHLDETTAMAIYRICQEAANNCVQHVGKGRFRIAISLLDGPRDTIVSLSIDDDGGEVPLYRTRTGRGLKSIADRADGLGAAYQFNLHSGQPRHALTLRLPNAPA